MWTKTACTSPNVTYDTAGRTSTWSGWTLTYDGEGRLASACKVAGCATGDMVTMRYDADGRRVELVTRPNGGSATTVTFRYQDGALAQELSGTTVSRTYVTDEAGRIVKLCDPDCSATNPQYLPVWNGHGDALAVWRIETSGVLTLANSYAYTSWGAATTFTHNGYSDLGLRFLYVGREGVANDSALNLGLLLMGARHYSPALGRFLQPDPTAAEANLYAYAGNSPVTKVDPSGKLWWFVAGAVARIVIGAIVGRVVVRVALRHAPRLVPAAAGAWLRAMGYRWSSHLAKHAISTFQVARTILFGQRFTYFHRGVCKIGFFMAATGVFVATNAQKWIYTAFVPDDPSAYVRNLKASPCP